VFAVVFLQVPLAVAWAGCQGAVDGAPGCEGDRFAGGDECVPLSRDPGNCGACGVTCGFGEICRDGLCRLSCATGLVACDGECRDLRSNVENCGACGNDCGPDAHCADSTCLPGPDPGMTGDDPSRNPSGRGSDPPPPHGYPPLP
jgi:hypothetical protein